MTDMKKINKVLILFSLILISNACEPKLDNVYTEERMQNDPAFTEGLLMQGYRLLANTYNYNETATDDAVTNNKESDFLRMATGNWTSSFNPMDVWNDCYNVIFYLNKFLSVIDNMEWSWQSTKRDDLFRARLKGEALAFRGYYHFILLMNHGGVDVNNKLMGIPVIRQVVKYDDKWIFQRSSYMETVNAIMADMDEAIRLLPFNYADQGNDGDYNRVNGSAQRGRLSGKIARALKARIAMYVASPLFNNGDYNQALCELAAHSAYNAISDNPALPANGLLFYDDDNDIKNPEIIWRNNYVDLRSWEEAQYPPSLYGRGEVNPTQNLVDVFPMQNGRPITEEGSGYNPQNPYSNRDPRLTHYIVYNGNKIGYRAIMTNKESTTDGLNNTTASTRTGYYLKKLLRPDVTLTPGSQNTRRHFKPHIRFTELYLIYAEAANEAWGPDNDPKGYGLTAKKAIAEIRKRAGINQPDLYLASITDKEQMRKLIRNERRIELCFEGFRFWDIRRWDLPMNEDAKGISIENNAYTVFSAERRLFDAYMKFGPIPLDETLKNKELSQNKGW